MRKMTWAAGMFLAVALNAQTTFPLQLPQGHPRYLTTQDGKGQTEQLIKEEKWAEDVFRKLKERTDNYVDRGSDWLSSRLQMYWNTHATDVFVRGEFYDHAGGEKAPAPTVVFTGSRGHATNYRRPKMEELKPYQEDPRGMYLENSTLKTYEWANIGKTGRIIESVNREIIGIARDAAFLWWMTGEEKYAKAADAVFDTYATGLYYRNVPVDLNHGHQQTLVGMTSFEVIHEDALNDLVPLYDFLYDYLKAHRPEKMDIYAGAFKKCADNIIANGVPHNNWNLLQAHYVMNIALVLEDDSAYADGKGRQYYIDYLLNKSSIRQWSLKKLAEYGFDPVTGIWSECPGYSSVVVGDYCSFVNLFDHNLNMDLTEEIPVLPKAVEAMPQYLFPNRMMCGFGDTHPGPLRTDIFRYMVSNARRHGKKEEERKFTAMLKLFDPSASRPIESRKNAPVAVTSFFAGKPLEIDADVKTGEIDDYVTPTFYAPNVSWLVQRNGMDRRNSLMVSLNGSKGNHMHANGISMELYGKGYVLGPDAGIGKTLYQGLDYLEYYSQFPSHNTVCVDGVSSYPVMMSCHSFKLRHLYPRGGAKVSYRPVSYSEVYFREPETYADQTRLNSIVNTSDSTGYYVDVFRSRKVEGKDKMHDYFYHNLGQVMTLKAADGSALNLQPTEELAFAGGHLYAYSYIYDKKCAVTDKDVRADFTVDMPDGDDITMTMWMKGEKNREVFTALSPMTEGLSRIKDMPYVIADQPTLTFVSRQHGEAWDRPFVAVYEPYTRKEPSHIKSVSFPEVGAEGKVAVQVELTDGCTDLILSSDNADELGELEGVESRSVYSLVRTDGEGRFIRCFMGGGTSLRSKEFSIKSGSSSDVLLLKKGGKWMYTASASVEVRVGGKTYDLFPSDELKPLD